MKLAPKLDVLKTHELDLGLKPFINKRKSRSENAGYTKNYKGHSSKTGSFISNNFITNKTQKCITKMSFRTTKDLHAKNLLYIQKEGKGRDGEEPLLYGSDDKETYEKNMADKNWRIIISPQSNSIDLTELTKEFVSRLEKYSGYKFSWIAANHYDTDNHHTHLLINGIDKNGRDVNFLPKGSYPKICSSIAKDLCTQMLGHKTKAQIRNEISRTAEASRYTFLDKKLEGYIKDGELSKIYMNDRDEEVLSQRLKYLESLDLCSFNKQKQSFHFKENWTEELSILGKYNMYYEGLKYAQVPQDKYSLHELSEKGNISGEILHKFIRQKDSNNFALVIKKDDGNVCFVPLNFYPENCFPGDKIDITMKDKRTYINKKGNHTN